MSELILPESCKPHRRNVQISDLRVCVLVHKDTNRVLCFAMSNPMTRRIAVGCGCKVIDIFHAHEYDKYAKIWREQAMQDSQLEDHLYLERENATRQSLRKQLRDKLPSLTNGAERKAVESALHLLEQMEKRKQRYRAESFLVNEAYEASNKNVGDELVNKLMLPEKRNA